MQKEESYLSILKENQKKQEGSTYKMSVSRQKKKQPAKRGLPDPKPIKEDDALEDVVPEIEVPMEDAKEPELSEELAESAEEDIPVLAEEEKEEPKASPAIKPLSENPRIPELGKAMDPEEAKKKIRRATLIIKEGDSEPEEPLPKKENVPQEIRISVGDSCEIVLSINVSVIEKGKTQ